jgi:electron transfer flavoprotein beta subunit
MKIVAFVKQIPNPDRTAELAPGTFTLVRGEDQVIDDADRYGVEVALSLRDASQDGEVIAVSMSPPGDTAGIRAALAMGVDRAVVVSDPSLAGADALFSAKVLADVVESLSPDLVIAATESTDGYTGTLPVQVSELLGWPSVTYATGVTSTDEGLRISRQTDGGREEVECDFPMVITVTAGIVEPRYPSMRGIMGARNKPIEVLAIAQLAGRRSSGAAVSAREAIVTAEPAAPRGRGEIVTDDGTGHERLVTLLEEMKLV